jgi:hypothetical protein
MTVRGGREDLAPKSVGGVIKCAGAQELNRLPDAADVMMQFFTEGFIAEKRPALFGGENGMNQNLCE